MSLNDREIKSAKAREKDYKLSDEKGLYLLVTKAGGKLFRLKYRYQGKEKKLSIGSYPDISLKVARGIRDDARTKLADGIDPSLFKKILKETQRSNLENSFEVVALEWFSIKQKDKATGTKERVNNIFNRYLFPMLGPLAINEIPTSTILATLKAIEKRGALETTRRARQLVSQIYRYAIATGRADRDPIPDLKGAFEPQRVEHHSAMTEPKDVGHLMVAIDNFRGTLVVQTAMKLSALFFCRPGEIRHLKWESINSEELRIEIISDKTKQPHIIPLSRQAITLLDELHPLTGRSEYILPSARGRSRPMSENAVRTALRTMGYDNDTMTAHGFRAMARTLLDEVLEYRIEWIEQQLAHAVKDPNGRAYNRTKHLKQRTEMMQRWADYLDELREQALAKNVVTGNFSRA
ncbi:MAG: integrase arm-type DNA-binding domain-containing protein [Oceanospirillaceae bacterium]|nr:integrase arm-type DNA-binding domain-containing protein [Oceanospirillaceae bacterium]